MQIDNVEKKWRKIDKKVKRYRYIEILVIELQKNLQKDLLIQIKKDIYVHRNINKI